MNGLPIGFYTGLLGLSAVAALASGIYALLRARNIARWTQRRDNDVVAGPREPGGGRQAGGSRVAVAICTVSTCLALAMLWLIASGTIGSAQARTSPEVQRP